MGNHSRDAHGPSEQADKLCQKDESNRRGPRRRRKSKRYHRLNVATMERIGSKWAKPEQSSAKDDAEQEDQHVIEIHYILESISSIHVDNVLHVSKVQRAGELHVQRGNGLCKESKRGEVEVSDRRKLLCRKRPHKVARSISDQPAKPFMFVERVRDIDGGGKKGQLTTDPSESDATFNRQRWKIFEGNAANLESKVCNSFTKYASRIFIDHEHQIDDIGAEMVYETFRRTPKFAPGMDGWRPRELSLLSIEVCRHCCPLHLQ